MLKRLLEQRPDSEIVILSGEGESGTYKRYTDKRTSKAIRSRLAAECCNGDRWAIAYIYLHESDVGSVYVNLEDTSDMRHINEDDIGD